MIRFLSVEEVEIIHAAVAALHGGNTDIRDRTLLESAIAMPRAQFSGQYLHNDLASMAAADLYHLNKNHAFIDGNKRVALAAAETFLELDGVAIDASNDDLVEVSLQVADGCMEKSSLAGYLRSRLRPSSIH